MILSKEDLSKLRADFNEFTELNGIDVEGDNEMYRNFLETIESQQQEIEQKNEALMTAYVFIKKPPHHAHEFIKTKLNCVTIIEKALERNE